MLNKRERMTLDLVLNRYRSHTLCNGLIASAKQQSIVGCIGHYLLDIVAGFQQWNAFRVLVGR